MSISFSSKTSTQITVNASYTGVVTSAVFYASSISRTRTLDGSGGVHSFSFTITGLSPSTTYNVSVEWFNGSTSLGTNSLGSITTDPAPPPPAPSPLSGLRASVSGYAPTSIGFSWNASSPVTSYSYTLRKDGSTVSSSSTTNTSISFSNRTAGTYTLGVTPFNGVTSGSGATVSITVYDPPPPPPPSNLAGLTGSSSGAEPASLGFSWLASSPVTSYSWALRKNGVTTDSGTTTATAKSFTGQMAGDYTLGVTPFNGVTQGTGAISNTVTVAPSTTVTPVPTPPTLVSRIDGGFVIEWGEVFQALQYELQYKADVNTVWQSYYTFTMPVTLDNLAYGLLYNFRVRALRNGVWSDFSSINNATVNPKIPIILSGSYNSGTSIASIVVGGMAGTPFTSIVLERINISTGATDSKSTATDGATLTWSITPATIANYKWRAYSVNGSLNSAGYSGEFTFNRPQNFFWTGGDKIQGANVVVLASDWNLLIDRINEFRVYKGLSTVSMTTVSAGTTITAAHYNQLANAINPMGSSGGTIPLVTGLSTNPNGANEITAWAINRLSACLNLVP